MEGIINTASSLIGFLLKRRTKLMLQLPHEHVCKAKLQQRVAKEQIIFATKTINSTRK